MMSKENKPKDAPVENSQVWKSQLSVFLYLNKDKIRRDDLSMVELRALLMTAPKEVTKIPANSTLTKFCDAAGINLRVQKKLEGLALHKAHIDNHTMQINKMGERHDALAERLRILETKYADMVIAMKRLNRLPDDGTIPPPTRTGGPPLVLNGEVTENDKANKQ